MTDAGLFFFQRTERYLQANMIQTAHAHSGYANTRTRTASRTWSPLQQIISSQKGDLHDKKENKSNRYY